MYLYIPIKQKFRSAECGTYTATGLCVLHFTRKKCCVPVVVPDVSLHFWAVCRLALRCTVGQLRPYQLQDVLEDQMP